MASNPSEREAEMAQQRQDNDNAAIQRAQQINARGGPTSDAERQAVEAGESAADHRRSGRRR